ncbi:MAG: MarR family transcriptional regulator [Synergistaceae bacterium]|jgi:DNA-binding MarR family transcriptional regulator|nr:MarR family transcriptional regulator [Synergistaceae bacterium]
MENNTELFRKFARAMWLLHRHHQYSHSRHGPMGDPHRGQGRILALLKMQPQISQKDLAFLLDMRPQSMGELLIKLERGGYITRTPSESDHRVLDIKLTEEGLNAANVAGEGKSHLDGLFDCFTADEQATLGEYLDRIMASMEKEFGDNAADFDPHEGGHAHLHDVHSDRRLCRGGGERGHGCRQGMSFPSRHGHDHGEADCFRVRGRHHGSCSQ